MALIVYPNIKNGTTNKKRESARKGEGRGAWELFMS
jgi:hypothetical protein